MWEAVVAGHQRRTGRIGPMAPTNGTKPGAPIVRFRPTNGFIIGYTGLAMCAFAVVYVAVSVHTLTGLRVGLGFALAGVVAWVSLLRPRAAVFPGVLRLKNSMMDIEIPLVLIDAVTVRQTLNVWVGERRYVCVGIGRSRHSMFKSNRRGVAMLFGMERLQKYAEDADRPANDQTGMLYETYVVTSIEELVEDARKNLGGEPPQGRVRRLPAWPEIAALAVLAVVFAVTFAL
jgi:hypothetical protein